MKNNTFKSLKSKTLKLFLLSTTASLFSYQAFADDTIRVAKPGNTTEYQKSPDSYLIKIYGISLCDTITCDNTVFPIAYNSAGVEFDIAKVDAGGVVGSLQGGIDMANLPKAGTQFKYMALIKEPNSRKIKGSITIPANEYGAHPETTCYTTGTTIDNTTEDSLGSRSAQGSTDQNDFGYTREVYNYQDDLDSNGNCIEGTEACSSTERFFMRDGKLYIVYPMVNDLNIDFEKIIDENITDEDISTATIDGINLPQFEIGIRIKHSLEAWLDAGNGFECRINEDNPVITLKAVNN